MPYYTLSVALCDFLQHSTVFRFDRDLIHKYTKAPYSTLSPALASCLVLQGQNDVTLPLVKSSHQVPGRPEYHRLSLGTVRFVMQYLTRLI